MTELVDDAAHDLSLRPVLHEIFFAWPVLRPITDRLASFTGRSIPGETGSPLLHECLYDAIRSYRETPVEEVGTADQMRRFVRGLLQRIQRVASVTVIAVDSGAKWDPLLDVPIEDWIETHGGRVDIVEAPLTTASDAAVRQMIVSRILSMQDLEWIEGVATHPLETPPVKRLYQVFERGD